MQPQIHSGNSSVNNSVSSRMNPNKFIYLGIIVICVCVIAGTIKLYSVNYHSRTDELIEQADKVIQDGKETQGVLKEINERYRKDVEKIENEYNYQQELKKQNAQPKDGQMMKFDKITGKWVDYVKPEPMLGMSGETKDGHPWMMYWDQVNFPIEQIKVLDGTTLNVIDKNGEHDFYIKMDLFTHHFDDWVSKVVIESELYSGKYQQIYAKVIHTFPDGDRICNVHFAVDKEGKQFLDLDKKLLDIKCAFKTQEEANKHYEANKDKSPDAAMSETEDQPPADPPPPTPENTITPRKLLEIGSRK